MLFRICDKTEINNWAQDNDLILLVNDDWNDWFQFRTSYQVHIRGELVGIIRIGRIQQEEPRVNLPTTFERLPDNCFSLGIGLTYYERIRVYDCCGEIYDRLNDLAFDLDLFENVLNEEVVKISLLRDVTAETVRGQLHRITMGGAVQTRYEINFETKYKSVDGNNQKLIFNVNPNDNPSSNIHVLIGNNGNGKTTLVKDMIRAAYSKDRYGEEGNFYENASSKILNIVNISFSVFDDPITELDIDADTIPYCFVGLKRAEIREGRRKLYVDSDLTKMFFDYAKEIIFSTTKMELWHKITDILNDDSTFKLLRLNSLIENDKTIESMLRGKNRKSDMEGAEYERWIRKEVLWEKIENVFPRLSSGHKIILLTVASLIVKVEESTLVFIDEPEEHLHPPLVSAFIQALSELLSFRNGVAIIATHSPVIVQAVPKNCVWIMARHGDNVDFYQPEFETYGENVGEIINEVFKYDVDSTGFHKALKKSVEQFDTYDDALNHFEGRLGREAKSILFSYMYEKENNGTN